MKCLICESIPCECIPELQSIKSRLEQGEHKFTVYRDNDLLDKCMIIISKYFPQYQFARYVYLISGGRENYIPSVILAVQNTHIVFHSLLFGWVREQYVQSPSPKELEHNFIYRSLTHGSVLQGCLFMLGLTVFYLIPSDMKRAENFYINRDFYILQIRRQAICHLEAFITDHKKFAKEQKEYAEKMKKRIESGQCFLDNSMIEDKFNRKPLKLLGWPQSTLAERIKKVPPTIYYTLFISFTRLGYSMVQYCFKPRTHPSATDSKKYGCTKRVLGWLSLSSKPRTTEMKPATLQNTNSGYPA